MKYSVYNIKNLTDEEYRKWYLMMSDDKRRRVDGFRFADAKMRTVAGDMLARKMISGYCGVDVGDIVFSRCAGGKPYVRNLDVYFNVSHSADMAVCAVDNKPIGIDIEKIRPVNLSVAKRVCTDDELRFIFGHHSSDDETLMRFFELWTKKEAYVKRIGTGISGLKNSLSDGYFETEIKDGYIITVCR